MNPFFGELLRLLTAPLQGFRSVAETEVDGLRVSTIYAGDLNQFETAIEDKVKTHAVERYDTEGQAVEGHRRWVEFCKQDNLTVTRIGYGTLIPDETITLVRR